MTVPRPHPLVELGALAVKVSAGAPAGIYEVRYMICDLAEDDNCSIGIVYVDVRDPVMIANYDYFDVNNGNSGAITPSIFDNDSNFGAPIDISQIEFMYSDDPHPHISMGVDGRITVAPGTPAGKYSYTYEVCEAEEWGNCALGEVLVVVHPAEIIARDDVSELMDGHFGDATHSVLDNDMLDGSLVNPDAIEVRPGISPHPNLTMLPNGMIMVMKNTPPGTYDFPYTICDLLNSDVCSSAVMKVLVGGAIVTVMDDFPDPINIGTGGQTFSVLDNDTYRGGIATLANVYLIKGVSPHSGIVMEDDGRISVAAGTPVGTYNYEYTIWPKDNPNIYLDAQATIVVYAPVIAAVDDVTPVIDTDLGYVSASVLDNDLFDNLPVSLLDVQLRPGIQPHANI